MNRHTTAAHASATAAIGPTAQDSGTVDSGTVDSGTVDSGTAASGRWRALVLLCAAQFMLIIDITVVNVALPSIARDLTLGRQALTWVVAAYSLCFGGLLMLGGRLADGLGRRTVFLTGLAAFCAASLVSGLAGSGSVLIGARAAQGVAAALMSPSALAIITTSFEGRERDRALGVWGAIAGAGAAVGVLVGGALTSGPGWRWIFFINVPIGLAVLLLVPTVVAAAPSTGSLRGLDTAGALSITGTAALLIYGFVHAGASGWATAGTLLPLAGAAVLAAVAVLVERSAPTPLIRPGLIRRREVVGGTLVMLAATVVMLTGFFLISWYLQHRLGYSALKTGLLYLPVAIAVSLSAHAAAHAIGHLGFRATATAGFALAGTGSVLLAFLPAHGNAAIRVLPGFILLALGIGACFVTATVTAMNRVERDEAGLVSGIVNTGHELGSALGVAAASVLAASSLVEVGGDVRGFHLAFAATAGLAAVFATVGARLLPAGRPEHGDGPVFMH